jgi:hypothetical protein
VIFVTLSKVYCQNDRLSSSRHQKLNFPDRRRKTRRWQSFGLALVVEAGENKSPVFAILVYSKLIWGIRLRIAVFNCFLQQ